MEVCLYSSCIKALTPGHHAQKVIVEVCLVFLQALIVARRLAGVLMVPILSLAYPVSVSMRQAAVY